MARRLGCWLLMLGLVVLGCLALSGCDAAELNATGACRSAGGTPVFKDGHYAHCDFPPPPCSPLPPEAP